MALENMQACYRRSIRHTRPFTRTSGAGDWSEPGRGLSRSTIDPGRRWLCRKARGLSDHDAPTHHLDREAATEERFQIPVMALDRRADLWLAESLAPPEQGLRGVMRNLRNLDPNRRDSVYGQETRPSGLNFSYTLLQWDALLSEYTLSEVTMKGIKP